MTYRVRTTREVDDRSHATPRQAAVLLGRRACITATVVHTRLIKASQRRVIRGGERRGEKRGRSSRCAMSHHGKSQTIHGCTGVLLELSCRL